MPHLNLAARAGNSAVAPSDCDVCIVGTGPAGATLAAELVNTNLRVTVLESGTTERTPEADLLNEIENVGRPRVVNQFKARNRMLGGSSHTWGGRSAAFDEIDFEARPWVPMSGWPIDLNGLDPYLRRSARHLGLAVGTGFSDDRFWELADRARPVGGPNPQVLLPFFWQFSRDPEESYPYEYMRFGRSLIDRLATSMTIITGATVVRILPQDSGRAVRGVEWADPAGVRRVLTARTVVLATGGIENARLLLASDSLDPRGLGNANNLVGRYLMDHLRGPVAHFHVPAPPALLKRLGRYNVRGHLFRAGLRLSPDLQRAEGLLNCAAWLGEDVAPDDPWDATRRFIRRRPDLPGDAVALLRGVPLFVQGARDYFVERNGIPRRFSAVSLLAMVEQQPDPESRVTLSEARDAFGSRLPRIDWRSHPEEGRTMRRTAQVVGEQLMAMGLPSPELADWVRRGEPIPDTFVDVAHPTGTTRMSTLATTGVVDADCQVHGIDGLFVAGSSVFPTSGHCNPTQMIVAMAIRLADHLQSRHARAVQVEAPVAAAPSRTVLVTGATGRIGRFLLVALLARGVQVRATTSREVSVTLDRALPGIEWRMVDLTSASDDELVELVAGCDAVLHLAAAVGNQSLMQALNADVTRALARASEQAGVRGFVYTSSVAVYGSGRTRLMSEDAPTLTVERNVASEYLAMDYVRTYGRTKLAGERALHEVARSVNYVVLRPTVVVDEAALLEIGDWPRSKRYLAAHRHAHHVYMGDVVDGIVWSMDRVLDGHGGPGSVQTFNLSDDDNDRPRHADFLRQAYETTGDARFKVPTVPGVFDHLHDLVRFRRLSLRNPLWRMRFPSTKIEAAGFRRRYGMEVAQQQALKSLRCGRPVGIDAGVAE